jgi:hypothetical protein
MIGVIFTKAVATHGHSLVSIGLHNGGLGFILMFPEMRNMGPPGLTQDPDCEATVGIDDKSKTFVSTWRFV